MLPAPYSVLYANRLQFWYPLPLGDAHDDRSLKMCERDYTVSRQPALNSVVRICKARTRARDAIISTS